MQGIRRKAGVDAGVDINQVLQALKKERGMHSIYISNKNNIKVNPPLILHIDQGQLKGINHELNAIDQISINK